MTPKEKFIRDVWYVLRRVKEQSLYAKIGRPIPYFVELGPTPPNIPTVAEESALLDKLAEWGVIKVKNPGGTPEWV